MEQLFSQQINPNLDMDELEAMCTEFKNDYNQRHFVRNESFKAAAENITGETRKIFIEFLERSCTAEFSGFLLYKVGMSVVNASCESADNLVWFCSWQCRGLPSECVAGADITSYSTSPADQHRIGLSQAHYKSHASLVQQ